MDNHKLQTDNPQADTAVKKAPTDDKKIHRDLQRLAEEESQNEISNRAYQLWQERGCPEGCAEEDWYRAESEITVRRSMNGGR